MPLGAWVAARLTAQWAGPGVAWGARLLQPLSWLYALLAGAHRALYAGGLRRTLRAPVPLLVVGNLVAGGAGKTPTVMALVALLRQQGWTPGVISRGHGRQGDAVQAVHRDSPAEAVGDEPLLIHLHTGAPVVVGRDRVAAARALCAAHPAVDILVADDGLQHHRLHHDMAVLVFDDRGAGNRLLLPAGPLREPKSRLASVDAVIQVVRGTAPPQAIDRAWRADYTAGQAYRLRVPREKSALTDLPPRDWLAVTGIGRPQGFFDMLQQQGVRFSPRAFADHHAFQPQDLPADGAVLMTEKDAVKCQGFAGEHWWAVQLDVAPEAGFIHWLDARLTQ